MKLWEAEADDLRVSAVLMLARAFRANPNGYLDKMQTLRAVAETLQI